MTFLTQIENSYLNLIPNHPTQNDGGTVNDIRGTHIVEQFFQLNPINPQGDIEYDYEGSAKYFFYNFCVIFCMKHLWLK